MDAQRVLQGPSKGYGSETWGDCDYTFHPFLRVQLHATLWCIISMLLKYQCIRIAIISSSLISEPQSSELQPESLHCLFISMPFTLLCLILFLAWKGLSRGTHACHTCMYPQYKMYCQSQTCISLLSPRWLTLMVLIFSLYLAYPPPSFTSMHCFS